MTLSDGASDLGGPVMSNPLLEQVKNVVIEGNDVTTNALTQALLAQATRRLVETQTNVSVRGEGSRVVH
jgi:hypothetical protein